MMRIDEALAEIVETLRLLEKQMTDLHKKVDKLGGTKDTNRRAAGKANKQDK